nr:MAG TPA: hypothetical protein [Caudoviricetes sp.]
MGKGYGSNQLRKLMRNHKRRLSTILLRGVGPKWGRLSCKRKTV